MFDIFGYPNIIKHCQHQSFLDYFFLKMWGSLNLCGICHLNNSLVGEFLYDQNDRSTDIRKLPAWFWVLMLLVKFPKQVVLVQKLLDKKTEEQQLFLNRAYLNTFPYHRLISPTAADSRENSFYGGRWRFFRSSIDVFVLTAMGTGSAQSKRYWIPLCWSPFHITISIWQWFWQN